MELYSLAQKKLDYIPEAYSRKNREWWNILDNEVDKYSKSVISRDVLSVTSWRFENPQWTSGSVSHGRP